MAPALLRMLDFEWQAINFLLQKAISFFTVCAIISGQLFDKASHFFNKIKATSGNRAIREEITI